MDNQRYAGFWIRVAAVLIDLVWMVAVILVPLAFIYGEPYFTGDALIHGFWDIFFNYILPFVLTIWFWLRFLGTPGKMILRLRIVDADTGNRMSLGQAVGRYFAYILSALPFMLGYLWVGVDRRKQGWHDKLAGTLVIRDTGRHGVMSGSKPSEPAGISRQ